MGLKKKNKVSAEFNMSSLTDIIFLLLIFFMLTSNLVAPNALNLRLPGSSKTKTVSSGQIDDVAVSRQGSYFFNGRRISEEDLEATLRRKAKGSAEQLNMTISPAPGAPTESVVFVMDLAMRLDMNGILATEKR